MTLKDFFNEVCKRLEYQQWERELHGQIDNRVAEVLQEQEEDTKWKRGFIEGMKYVLADPHKRIEAPDTETPAAEENNG